MTTTATAQTPFNRLLLTGAAGGLGKVLRESLRPYANVIRLSDIADIAPAIDDREEVVPCDLADKHAVHQLVEGVDAILHFGGVSVERSFEEILGANLCAGPRAKEWPRLTSVATASRPSAGASALRAPSRKTAG